MISFLSIIEIPSTEETLRSLWVHLCQIFYPLVGWLFDLFIEIGSFNLIGSDGFTDIYKRITLLLAIIMVFYVTFQFVKYVVQPNDMTDKEKGVGNIAFKMLAVVLLIAFTPKIFDFAYQVQSTVIEEQVFTKIFLNKPNVDTKYFGKQFSKDAFSMFYYYDYAKWEDFDGENECDGISCAAIVQKNYDTLTTIGKLSYLSIGINEPGNYEEEFESNGETITETVTETYINFDGFLAAAFGAFIVYMLAMYCIDVGARAVQLVFLQIIAPIPIIGYLSPKKDGIFQKWCKQCVTTYLDIFIRFAIIYFILLVCQTLLSSSAFDNIGETGFWVKIALIMGLLMFANRAPKMLKELFPGSNAASGTFGLSSKDRLEPTMKALKPAGRIAGAISGTVIGAGIGLATGLGQGIRRKNSLSLKDDDKHKNLKKFAAGTQGALTGAVTGALGGATRGLVNGGKKGNVLKNVSAGAKKQIEANKRFGTRQENGYTFADQMEDRFRHTVGAPSRIENLEADKAPLKRQSDIQDKIFSSNKAMRDEAKKHIIEEGKGKYSGEYKAAAARVRALKEDEATRSEYKVGKYKTQAEADAAYETAKKNAMASVIADNFRKNVATLDVEAYETARKNAADSVIADNFKRSDGTLDVEAYETARKNAMDSVIADNFRKNVATLDVEAYEAEKERMASQVEKDQFTSQISKYATQEDADEAYRRDLAAADKALDEAEKKAINDFIDHGEWDEAKNEYVGHDKKIMQIKRQLAADVRAYNAHSATEAYKVDEIVVDEATGQITVGGVKVSTKDFHQYAKDTADKKVNNTTRISDIDAEIEQIKRTTSGSGIAGDKK